LETLEKEDCSYSSCLISGTYLKRCGLHRRIIYGGTRAFLVFPRAYKFSRGDDALACLSKSFIKRHSRLTHDHPSILLLSLFKYDTLPSVRSRCRDAPPPPLHLRPILCSSANSSFYQPHQPPVSGIHGGGICRRPPSTLPPSGLHRHISSADNKQLSFFLRATRCLLIKEAVGVTELPFSGASQSPSDGFGQPDARKWKGYSLKLPVESLAGGFSSVG